MAPDPFATLGLPRTFDLTRAEIESAYLIHIRTLHPDAGASPDDPAVDDLNHARQQLSDPEQRANILLSLLGGPPKEQDRSLPPGFLARMLEVREELEAAAASGDQTAIRTWAEWAERERDAHILAVRPLFASLQSAPSPDALKTLRARLNAWRYIERMLESSSSSTPTGS